MGRPASGPKAKARAGLLAAVFVATPLTPAPAQDSLEMAVKASYLAKFPPFVDWPPSAAPSANFSICIVGRDPFGPLIDRAVAGQSVAGQALTVERLKTVAAQSSCRIAFIGGSRLQPVKDALRALRGAPVLTVTDAADTPGIIDFAVAQGRVRFRVDDRAAADDGLTISSKLLGLALSVIPRPGSEGAR